MLLWLVSALAGCGGGGAAASVEQVRSSATGYVGLCDVDSTCGCAAAYSMTRAMRQAYDGPLFRLTRDDGAVFNVPQTSGRLPDLSNVFGPMGFCATAAGAASPVHCYVDGLYDQSGSTTGNQNDLATFTGNEASWQGTSQPNVWGVNCGSSPARTCSPPFSISARYNLPVLFTPYPTGLADCPNGSPCTMVNVPHGNVNKTVLAYVDNRQGSRCCGSDGVMEGLDDIQNYPGDPPGTMFGPILSFGTFPNLNCAGAFDYCASIDLEGGSGTTWDTGPFPPLGRNAGNVLIEGKYTTSTQRLDTFANGQLIQSGTTTKIAGGVPVGAHVRAGLAGDATPVQEATFEFAVMACTPTNDAGLYTNVSQFYGAAQAAATAAQAPGGSTSIGPGDLAALNNNLIGKENANTTLPAPDMLYSRMFAGWSLRRLNASYTGPLVQLRRDDNQLSYFGASSSGTGLDPAASAWCMGHACRVVAWPCQASVTPAQEGTWSASHDTSSCPTLTPPSGTGPLVTFNSLNGQATLHFDHAMGNWGLCHTNTNGMTHYWSVAAVARQASASSSKAAVVGMNGGSTELGFLSSAGMWNTTSTLTGASAAGAKAATWHSLIGTNDYGTGALYLDGVASSPASFVDVPGGSTLCVGQASSNGADGFTGDVAEVTLSYDLTGPAGALQRDSDGLEYPPDPVAYSDPNTGNVLFNNQELAWGTLNNSSGTTEAVASPAIFVDPHGRANVVVMGPNNSLNLYYATPGSSWTSVPVAPAQTTFSSPSIFVRSDGQASPEIDIVAMGPNNSLEYYYQPANQTGFTPFQIDGALTTYSIPSIYVRTANPSGRADIVVQGPDYSLVDYAAVPNGAWQPTQMAGPLSAYSQPSTFVRDGNSNAPGELDVAVQGPENSLWYFYPNGGGGWNSAVVAGPDTTYSAPTMQVRTGNPANEVDIVAQGPNNSLYYYYAAPGAPFTTVPVLTNGTTFGAPGFFMQPTGEADIVVRGPTNNLTLYYATPPGGLMSQPLTGPAAYAPPRIFARSGAPVEKDVVTIGANNVLLYYYDRLGNGSWQNGTITGTSMAF